MRRETCGMSTSYETSDLRHTVEDAIRDVVKEERGKEAGGSEGREPVVFSCCLREDVANKIWKQSKTQLYLVGEGSS